VDPLPHVRQPFDFSEPIRYAHGPDSVAQEGVPQGRVVEHQFADSRVFPGTSRRYWVYAPAEAASSQAGLMVFQDGRMYLDPKGEIRAGVVLDNLIHHGEMPPTIGVFVDPGEPGNRNVEYDAFTDAYATFLLTEILPMVLDTYDIADDPDQWGICGGSSGGSCALTVAWMRPDRFRRVISFLGSFAQLEGGNAYPQLIRQTPKEPHTCLPASGDTRPWLEPARVQLAQRQPPSCRGTRRAWLRPQVLLGDGGHDANHGGAILPDALRWLWRP